MDQILMNIAWLLSAVGGGKKIRRFELGSIKVAVTINKREKY
jgi:hypothetical protein